MQKGLRLVYLSIVAVCFATSVLGSVGTTPGTYEAGELDPGETYEGTYYISTRFTEAFTLEPTFNDDSAPLTGNEDIGQEVSEQDFGEWVSVSPAEIDPNSSLVTELGDGSSTTRYDGQVDFVVDVPEDAEPGYRRGYFRLNPDLGGDGEGAGARTIGEVMPTLFFRVSGHAERGIEVNNVRGVRVGEDTVQLIMQLQNTGTVTTTFEGGEITILDSSGNDVDELGLNSAKLSPGEVAEIDTTWSSDSVEGGDYQVEGLGDYRTGETQISGDFTVTDVVRDPVEIDEPDSESEDAGVPYTLLIMALVFLGLILYFLDIGLVWIVIFVGATGVGLFILLSSAPTYLILILGAVIGVILYYEI